jgi:hypothetical protein
LDDCESNELIDTERYDKNDLEGFGNTGNRKVKWDKDNDNDDDFDPRDDDD